MNFNQWKNNNCITGYFDGSIVDYDWYAQDAWDHQQKEIDRLKEGLKVSAKIISKQVMYGNFLNSTREDAYDFNDRMHKENPEWFKDEPVYCEPC